MAQQSLIQTSNPQIDTASWCEFTVFLHATYRFFWLSLAGSDHYPCHLSFSINPIYHLPPYDTLNFLHKWAESLLYNRNHFRRHSKQLCLDPSFAFLHTLSPHDTILTKRQALAPSSPMSSKSKAKLRLVRLEFCCKAAARAWQETNDLRNTMGHTAHIPQSCENLPVALLISKLRFQMVSGITNISNNERRLLINDTLHCEFSDLLHSANLTYCTAWLKQWLHHQTTFTMAPAWRILEMDSWTHREHAANMARKYEEILNRNFKIRPELLEHPGANG